MTDSARQVVGVDTGTRSLADADHLIHHLAGRLGLPGDAVACTHLIRSGTPHVAVAFAVADAEDAYRRLCTLAGEGAIGDTVGIALGRRRFGVAGLAESAAEAVDELAGRRAGRGVVYPGAARLMGTVTVDVILTHTGIDRVTALGSERQPGPYDDIQTRDHVRPEWQDGLLTLVTTPLGPGHYAPFEVPNPTPCCADHR